MGLAERAFWGLLLAVALSRLLELRRSASHQRWLLARGARPVAEPGFVAMVALHAGVLVGTAAEVIVGRRPMYPALALGAFLVLLGAEALRWWAIKSLGRQWTVRVIDSTELGIVTAGPYRWMRHPNYAAVFIEMIALPLIHTAWITASVGAAFHLYVLRRRIALEESVLLAQPAYRSAMGHRPRFLLPGGGHLPFRRRNRQSTPQALSKRHG